MSTESRQHPTSSQASLPSLGAYAAQLQAAGVDPLTAGRHWELLSMNNHAVRLARPARLNDGIVQLTEVEQQDLAKSYHESMSDLDVIKFIPSSGAATRMFQFLKQFVQDYNIAADKDLFFETAKTQEPLQTFLQGLERLPFYTQWRVTARSAKPINTDDARNVHEFVTYLLDSKQAGLPDMPKGLVPFHTVNRKPRTAFQEHLTEAELYSTGKTGTRAHFTVQEEHQAAFEQALQAVTKASDDTRWDVSFSIQSPSTNTIAMTMDGNLLIDEQGKAVTRPGGHGALLPNLNQLDADLILIKNVDNVTTSQFLQELVYHKKVLAGLALKVKASIDALLKELDEVGTLSRKRTKEIPALLKELHLSVPADYDRMPALKQSEELRLLLDRPLRVCGMVQNVGEPGGGPFHVYDQYGRTSLQIVESAQVDRQDAFQSEIFRSGTHFNPVDLACCTKDYKGKSYDLMQYRDDAAVIITEKHVAGQDARVLELPGLWNGAMAHWNTIFVEVPLATFNPVKTVNDLLKPAHQS